MPAVAIYARYSSDLQRDASIEDQIRLCTERAEKEGWKVANCYSDHGLSGASLMRPGVQMLLQDALNGKFDILMAESLDRISRDQEDIAHIHKRLNFAGIGIVTLSEGAVNELHIGLKGTMGALYLKDLADKTRRGLRGRVEAGKSGGGNSYGYDVVHKTGSDGERIRGDRRINEFQAGVVRRIFNEYAAGRSPRAIAQKLNREKVGGPSGKAWGPSTIHGNRQRGTGILNNELYIGRLVWNRLRYVKAPDTGKRISRLNPEDEWIVQDVPELRILDQRVWDAVKARQGEMKASTQAKAKTGYWDRRRPRYLLSGLMTCGVCGGGVVHINAERVGCFNARDKGTCSNLLTLRRDELETLVLEGLEKHLMEPALVETFCEHYTRHINRLVAEHNAGLNADRDELERVNREVARLVKALLDGVPAAQVKDKMLELEERQQTLEKRVRNAKEMPVSLHPNLAGYYREQIGRLREALQCPDRREQAAAALRPLIDRIELTPVGRDGQEIPSISLHGRLAGILALAMQTEKRQETGLSEESIKLVAGARNRRCQQGLFQAAA